MRRLLLTLLLALPMICPAPAAAGRPSPLRIDRGFGRASTAVPALGPAFGEIGFVAARIEGDGTVLAARQEARNGGEVAEVYRYGFDGTPEGELEDRYDQSGPEVPDGEGNFLRPAGRYVKRMLPDGSPDTSFGTADTPNRGTSEPIPCQVEAVLPLPSGQIVAGGRECLARLEHDGTYDESFGEKGTLLLGRIGVNAQRLLAIEPGPDGDVVLVLDKTRKAPYSERRVPEGSLTAAVTPQATLDTSYGNGGTVEMPFEIGGASATSDGGVVLGGDTAGETEYVHDPHSVLVLTRLAATGAIDAGFGSGGQASLDLGGFDLLHSLALEADGDILVGGAMTTNGALCLEFSESFCEETPFVARFSPDGDLDTTYGDSGVSWLRSLTAPFSGVGGEGVLDLDPRPGGGELAVGGSGPDAFLAELDAGGTPDPAFAGGGIRAERLPGRSSAHVGEIGVDSKGRILAIGGTTAGAGPEAPKGAVFRFRRDGALDRTYGGGTGFVRVPGNMRALAVTPRGGAFVLSGEFTANLVAHVTPRGELDRSFGFEGAAPLPKLPPIAHHGHLRPTEFDPRALVALPGGGVLIGGESGESYGGAAVRMAVVKLDRRGRLARSFGKDGIAILGYGRRGNCNLADMARAPDGRILLAGKVRLGRPQRRVLSVAEIGPQGKPVLDFGHRGLATAPSRGESKATTIAWGAGGFFVGGIHRTRTGSPLLLLRFSAAGHLEPAFGRRAVRELSRSKTHREYPSPDQLVAFGKRVVLLSETGPPLSLFSDSGAYLATLSPAPPSRREQVAAAASQGGDLLVASNRRLGSAHSSFVLRRYLTR